MKPAAALLLLFLCASGPACSGDPGAPPAADAATRAAAARLRVMVVIPESHIHREVAEPQDTRERRQRRKIPDPAAETEIIKRLLEAGFAVVDQQRVAAIRDNDRVRAALTGNTALAAKIGLEHGADVMIVGEAFSEVAGWAPGRLLSCRARVEAKAVQTDTGEILAADGKHAAGLDVAEAVAGKTALRKAGGELADYFTQQLLARVAEREDSPGRVEMVVSGLGFADFVTFKSTALTAIPDIRVIRQRSFSGTRAITEVESSSDAVALAEKLAAATLPGFAVSIEQVSANRLMLDVHTASSEGNQR